MLKLILLNFNSLLKVHIFNNEFRLFNKYYLIGHFEWLLHFMDRNGYSQAGTCFLCLYALYLVKKP